MKIQIDGAGEENSAEINLDVSSSVETLLADEVKREGALALLEFLIQYTEGFYCTDILDSYSVERPNFFDE